MEHTEKEGFIDRDGYTAWQSGYDDAMYDGIDTSSEMPCKCGACLEKYYQGQQAAMKELAEKR